jgi:hypothetical protein
MRTVTFADPAVIRDLQTHFVLFWHDQSAGSVRPPPGPGTPEQAKSYPEGGGGTNVLTYVAAPDGRAVLRLQGFWRPVRYLAELRFARELASAVSAMPHDLEAVRFAADRIADRARLVGMRRAEIERRHPEVLVKKTTESEPARTHATLVHLEKTLGPESRPNLEAVEAVVAQAGPLKRLKLPIYT